jgi:ketosteroid isomerase-like protein
MPAAALTAVPIGAAANPLEDRIQVAHSAWNAVFSNGGAEAISVLYTGDASLLPAIHEVIQGPKSVERFFSSLFPSGVTDHTLGQIRTAGNNKIVVATAKWSAAGRDASGKAVHFSRVATHVFEWQPDGSLKLKLHAFD